jgi:2-amino-4-hydroxy-6-hydroxymethyldihydropteridine diphosphokinase
MNKAFLLFGSNIGDAIEHINSAISNLENNDCQFISKSSFYETMPWGFESNQAFVNQVSFIETKLSPIEFLELILKIEIEMGRIRNIEQYSSRNIDIDILYYNDEILDAEKLIIPHPRLHLRNFTLIPLTEIAPEYIHPLLKKSNKELLENCSDQLSVKKLIPNNVDKL